MSHKHWPLIFRISGTFLVASLIGLVLPLDNDISRICWIVGGLSLPICLYAAKKLKDIEKANSLADAARLKDRHFSEEIIDAADD